VRARSVLKYSIVLGESASKRLRAALAKGRHYGILAIFVSPRLGICAHFCCSIAVEMFSNPIEPIILLCWAKLYFCDRRIVAQNEGQKLYEKDRLVGQDVGFPFHSCRNLGLP
jgi:hypothetical protein